MKIIKSSTYRGHKLRDHEKRILEYWQNDKTRKDDMKFCLEGVRFSRKDFNRTFPGVLEKDRLEAKRTGKKWPEDYLKKMK